MKRPNYISAYEWDQMSDFERMQELEELAKLEAKEAAEELEANPRTPKPTRSEPREPKEPAKKPPKWELLKPEAVREAFAYDPQTGNLYRRFVKRCTNRREFADLEKISPYPVGTLHPLGFTVLKFQGKQYYAHRLAWLLMTGEEPRGQLRHLNGNRSDNRWLNLALVQISD